MEDAEGAEESQAVHLIQHLVHRHRVRLLIQNPNLHVPALLKAIENMVREEALLYRNLVDQEAGHLVLLVLLVAHLPLVLLVHRVVHRPLFRGIHFAIVTEEFQFI